MAFMDPKYDIRGKFNRFIPREFYDPAEAYRKVMGQNDYQPPGYRLDQTQANTERDLALESRGGQQWLGGQLQAQIRGLGPTVAGQQQRYGMAEAMRAAGTQAANARGVNRGMALRESLYAGQDAQAQGNRDAALMRASEQLGATGQYGGLVGQQRAGDIQSRQVSLDAEKANQQAEMQRQGYQTQLADANATRAQKGAGAMASMAGSIVKGLSDIRAKEDIRPMDGGSFADRLASVRQSDNDELARRAQAEADARISAMLASSNAGYGAQQAALRNNETNGLQPTQDGGGLMDQAKSQGIAGSIGTGLESFGNGLMSDEKSKERIRFLEGELYGRPRREVDQQNPYRSDYMSEAERSVEDGFDSRATAKPWPTQVYIPKDGERWENGKRVDDSRANLRGVRPYEFRYRPAYAELMAEQAAGNAPAEARPAVAAEAYGEARIPRVGVMAQELEKTPGGRKVVESTPFGKVLDMKRSVAFTMANQADMNLRLAQIEKAVGGSRK
jgi:hypothetical protein